MEGELQNQGQLDQYLEELLSPRGSQSIRSFFSEEDQQEPIWMEYLDPEGAIISKQSPEGEDSTMVVVKWSEKMKGSGDNIYSPLYGGLQKEEDESLVLWSGTDPDAKMHCFTWSKERNGWTFLGYQKNEEFKNWREPIHNGHFRSQNLKKKRNTKET